MAHGQSPIRRARHQPSTLKGWSDNKSSCDLPPRCQKLLEDSDRGSSIWAYALFVKRGAPGAPGAVEYCTNLEDGKNVEQVQASVQDLRERFDRAAALKADRPDATLTGKSNRHGASL